MKKVRVYELAKEAGLDNKELVAKLQEWGYAVKSHSSSLDEDVALKARQQLGLVQMETEEKRVQQRGQTTIIRRRKAVAVEEAERVSAAPEAVPEAEAEASEAVPVAEAVSETGPEVEAAIPEPEEPKAVEAVAEQPAPEEVPASVEHEAAGIEPETTPVAEAAPEGEAAKPTEAPREERPRKGLARIIKKAAITITPAPPPPPRPRPATRPGGPAGRPQGRPPVGGAGMPPGPPPTDEAGKPKHKAAKRFVRFEHESEAERARRAAAAGKQRPRRQADVSLEEVDELGVALPSGLRVGRGVRGGGKKFKPVKAEATSETKAIKKRITVHETITVSDIAHRMGVKANEVIAKLMRLGVMATVNQAMDVDTATLLATEFGYEVELGATEEHGIINLEEQESGGEMMPRPPVVTVMGHVDHGKTSILDAIRKTDVAAGEAGGITQHIGAHYVRSPQGDVVFLDTPGHAAFTEMRSRGAQVTDLVVLVVAADDGVMEQTKEAVNHARAAKVPILVCVNKIDKANADPSRVKRELADLNLLSEEWGGDVIFCETSAKQGTGIDNLMENILLQAEVLDLKADPKRRARGHVIEAQLHKGRGPVATVLVQQGTLRVGDYCVVGQHWGKVRSMVNDKGELVKEAGPAMPVEVQGLSGVPLAGDEFVVVPDEKMAKNVSAERQMKSREVELASDTKISLDNLFAKLKESEIKELRIALRTDVQGTLEAFGSALEKLSTEEIKVRILHSGTGAITESDVLLAAASDALIIGFNVRPSTKAQELAKQEKVEIRYYDVIYHALEDIQKAMVGMLEPEFEESVIGTAEVRQTFQVSRVGTIAGVGVSSGKVERNAKVRLLRDSVVVYTGTLSSLKRFKDDVKEVLAGYECGLSLENFNDIKVGDTLEFFVMKEIAREL
ncbi:MAG: translation initiation factor IF-2 [Thermodesulfobacteriota bacterium]